VAHAQREPQLLVLFFNYAYSLFRVCVVQINIEKACEASFFNIYLFFEKAQSAVAT
jgi:hypothetical protein